MLINLILLRKNSRWRGMLYSTRLFWPRHLSSAPDFVHPLLFILLLSLVTLVDCVCYFWGAVGLDFPYQWLEKNYYMNEDHTMEHIAYGAALKVIGAIQIIWLLSIVAECALSVFAAVGALVSYALGIVLALFCAVGILSRAAQVAATADDEAAKHKKDDDLIQQDCQDLASKDIDTATVEESIMKQELSSPASSVRQRIAEEQHQTHKLKHIITEVLNEEEESDNAEDCSESTEDSEENTEEQKVVKSLGLRGFQPICAGETSRKRDDDTTSVGLVVEQQVTVHVSTKAASVVDQVEVADLSSRTVSVTDQVKVEDVSTMHVQQHRENKDDDKDSRAAMEEPQAQNHRKETNSDDSKSPSARSPRSGIPQRSGIPRLKTTSPR